MCVVRDKPQDHVIVMVAVDGSPEIAALVKKILDDGFPDKGLDGDAAAKLNDQFDRQMKYFIAPDSPAAMPGDMPRRLLGARVEDFPELFPPSTRNHKSLRRRPLTRRWWTLDFVQTNGSASLL
jgi:hypothetical protein